VEVPFNKKCVGEKGTDDLVQGREGKKKVFPILSKGKKSKREKKRTARGENFYLNSNGVDRERQAKKRPEMGEGASCLPRERKRRGTKGELWTPHQKNGAGIRLRERGKRWAP